MNMPENNYNKLEKLKIKISNELICPLKETAKNLVFGKGNPDAQIMFIGEAPGEQEDIQGAPFVGAAGRELDRLLKSIGLSIEKVYIANILKYRPPNNRPPKKDEIERHTPYLIEQIKIIQPKIIITLGNYSTKFFLADFDINNMNKISGITLLHGKIFQKKLDNTFFKVIPTFHPAAILYNPFLRKEIEKDFQEIKRVINSDFS